MNVCDARIIRKKKSFLDINIKTSFQIQSCCCSRGQYVLWIIQSNRVIVSAKIYLFFSKL